MIDKHMSFIDTLTTRTLHRSTYNLHAGNNQKIEKLVLVSQDTTLNISSISGNPSDTSVRSFFWLLQVFDEKGQLKFSWNPLFQLDPKLFDIKGQLAQMADGWSVRWKTFNNVSWDYDGNILYSADIVQSSGLAKYPPKMATLSGM